MCGLVYDSTGHHAAALMQHVAHRGPDQQRLEELPGNMGWVGHTRLSLVDAQVEDAQQPRTSARSITLFNGELFGFNELHSGTEIALLQEMLDQDQDALQLNGYYAAISIRPSEHQVVLVRDLFGVMPLFYVHTAELLIVCSEQRALKLLNCGLVRQVLPGSRIVFELRQSRWVRKSSKRTHPLTSFGGNVRTPVLRALLQEAVGQCYMHADVPPALALSDGYDSRVLLACLRSMGSLPTCYTVTPGGEVSSELIRYMDGYLGVWHRITPTDADVREALQAYRTRLQDLLGENPIARRAFVRQWLVARNAKERIILCGEGADEVFCGYPPHAKVQGPELGRKRLGMLRSMSIMTLYRANLAGMLNSVEYRVPYLDRTLTSYVLSCMPMSGKQDLRLLYNWDIPKYTKADHALDAQINHNLTTLN